MRKSNPHVKILRCLCSLSLALILALSSSVFPQTAHAQTVEELEEKYNKLEKQLKENEKKLSDNAEDRVEQKDKIASLESQINDLNEQIDILDAKIAVLNSDIQGLNDNILALDAEIEDVNAQITATRIEINMAETNISQTYKKYMERMKLSYMMGQSSRLELLIGADSLSDILTRQQFLQNAAKYDNELIKSIEEDIDSLNEMNVSLDAAMDRVTQKKAEVEKEKKELQAKQASVQSTESDLTAKKYTADAKRGDAVAMLKTLDKESEEYKRMNEQLAAEKIKVSAEIDALIAAQGSSEGDEMPVETKNDGSLIWPLPYPNCYISAYYGQYPSGGEHHGVDICVSGGTEGKNIVAAQSGRAMTVGYGHWSMGNYIILDHGNGLFTAYYHCSQILISEGQTVKQGQVIAKAGQTGNTTGPHLHFEVRKNQNGTVVRQNPLNYVSMP
ncbi:MAG: peptidoglycan DD-metalloendopeptidase family protein [Clostridia bacterium]|nr:peptidoglycan DD-metalloendopeptidase family protein [Clostridia bacterium]